jgi:hypothetical protein
VPEKTAEGRKDHDDGDEDDRQCGKQNGECDLVGGLLPLCPLDEIDHPIQERLTRLSRDPYHDPVGQHLGAAGHRGTVAAGLPDHRSRFTGDRRFVDGCRPGDDLAFGRNDVTRLADHHVLCVQFGCGNQLLATARQEAPGVGGGARLAQRFRLCLASALGHRLGEVREQHRQRQPHRDRPCEHTRVGDRVDQGDDRSDQHHEHDGVLDLYAWIELSDRIDGGVAHDLGIEQVAPTHHPARTGPAGLRLGAVGNRDLTLGHHAFPSMLW